LHGACKFYTRAHTAQGPVHWHWVNKGQSEKVPQKRLGEDTEAPIYTGLAEKSLWGRCDLSPRLLIHTMGAKMSEKEDGSVSIRACKIEDAEAVLELWRQGNATPSVTDTIGDLQRAVNNLAANVLVAEVDGRIVGSIIGTFDGWRGNIYRLAVLPDYRRQGVASALVVEVEKKLEEQGAKRITALVEKDHPSAMSFWDAVGYRVDERIVRRVRTL
jgi:ribosomal protein S18 acetylase RimI-like enzyme